ncbi:MAG TPA: TonB-dependent receptor [Cyclobacteriaceae bacterium]|nr:TonB-dependent receptor [Cyclobacteriaceae bacterium]
MTASASKLFRIGLVMTGLFLSADIHGQQTRISGDYASVPFDQFVKQVEGQTSYHFYYRPAWIDSVFVQMNIRNERVDSVLDKIFKGTTLYFTIHNDQIYITKERSIINQLPEGFFNEQVKTTTPSTFDYSDYEKKERQKIRAEEKLYLIGTKTTDLSGTATLTGNISDVKSGEAIVGSSVLIENPRTGVSTDPFGHYAITLPRGRHELVIQSIGMKSTRRQIMLYGNGRLDVEVEEDVIPLKEVLVQSERDVKIASTQMGVEKIDIKTMKQMPLALGEADVMKVVLALPGVQSVGEGTTGLNVRGGATNQNLILFNDAVVYNPSHLFGFFSTFNPDALKNVELYKSGITADYGGRLSSVLDVKPREGNLKKFTASGGISPVTGRLTLEGPIIKDRTSFLLAVRSTYSDWILHQLNYKNLKASAASFYDITLNLNHKINDKNSISLAGYISQDKFRLGSDTTYSYSDRNGSIKWKHVFNPKLFGTLTGSMSQYSFSVNSSKNPVNAFTMDFTIRQWNAKADFNYFLSSKHTVNAGASVTRYNLAPGSLQPYGAQSLVAPDVVQSEQAFENAVYLDDNFEINSRLSANAGLRYSFYQYLGPRDVNLYAAGVPRSTATVTETIHYGSGTTIANYGGFEPRLSFRYMVTKNSSVKLSYNRMRQYIQMLSNTTAITPIDIWKLSDSYIQPQYGDQVSLGMYKAVRGNTIELSIEGYYKEMQNTVDYKNGAVLLLNHNLETDVINAKGKAYGVEFLIKKSTGKLNGWLSYTYSRSLLQTNGQYASEIINNGEYYPSSYDKPHAVNMIGNYKFNRRFNFSMNVVYSTGRPVTLPVATYSSEGIARIFYSDRNQFRIPDYFRTDISINVEGNHKIRKLAHSSWTFAVYNLLGRANAYSVYFVYQNGVINGYKLSVFAQPIPTITYNFKF